jgi:hypothetical protein
MERRLHEWALPTLRHYGAPEGRICRPHRRSGFRKYVSDLQVPESARTRRIAGPMLST